MTIANKRSSLQVFGGCFLAGICSTLAYGVSPESAADLVTKSSVALEQGEIEIADRFARKAVAEDPNDPTAVFHMGRLLAEQNRFWEAIRLLDKFSQRVPPSRLPVLGQTAEWMVLSGQWADAEQRFRTVLSVVPDAVPAHRQLAQLLLRQGRRLEAQVHLQTLCRIGDVNELELRSMLCVFTQFPGDAQLSALEPIGVLGKARNEISQGHFAAAVELLSKASLDNHEIALLGRLYAEHGEVEKLAEWYQVNGLLIDGSADYWIAAGIHRANLGDDKAAMSSLCNSILIDSTDASAYINLSRMLEEMGETDEAAVAAQRARWIRRTQTLGALLSSESTREAGMLEELASLLDKLHRPYESLCWKAMHVAATASALPTDVANDRIDEINRQRKELIQSTGSVATERFLLCGITPQSIGDVSESEAAD